eukprot:g993.t1
MSSVPIGTPQGNGSKAKDSNSKNIDSQAELITKLKRLLAAAKKKLTEHKLQISKRDTLVTKLKSNLAQLRLENEALIEERDNPKNRERDHASSAVLPEQLEQESSTHRKAEFYKNWTPTKILQSIDVGPGKGKNINFAFGQTPTDALNHNDNDSDDNDTDEDETDDEDMSSSGEESDSDTDTALRGSTSSRQGCVWCFVEHRSLTKNTDHPPLYLWRTQKELVHSRSSALRSSTSRLPLASLEFPPLALDAKGTASLRSELELKSDKLVKVTETFRRYRVKAEITARQKDTQISKIRDATYNLQQGVIQMRDDAKLSHEQQELAAVRRELREMRGLREDGIKREDDLRRQVQELQNVNERLKVRASIQSKQQDNQHGLFTGRDEDFDDETSPNNANGILDDEDAEELEYRMYRKQARKRLFRRDQLIRDILVCLQDTKESQLTWKVDPNNSDLRDDLLSIIESANLGGEVESILAQTSQSTPSASGHYHSSMHFPSNNNSSGPGRLPNSANVRYLKNVTLKYMTTTDLAARKHMEAAIATCLNFTHEEREYLKKAHENAPLTLSLPTDWFGA